VVPLGLHWCLATPHAPFAELQVDGHHRSDALLPPVPLPLRMWAGGEIEMLAAFHVGDTVLRRSVVTDVELKMGKAGPLCFVRLQHEYLSRGSRLMVRERQDIVYRNKTSPAPKTASIYPDSPCGMTPASALAWQITADPRLLFRYSALTFNAHRIHYDYPYATGAEGYAGLVVHGPLQATLLLNIAATLMGRAPSHLVYRGLAPLIAGPPFTAAMQSVDLGAGNGVCWIQSSTGSITMRAEAVWT